MHRAPAVNFPVKRARWQFGLVVCLSLLSLAALVAFTWAQTTVDLRSGGLALLILVTSGSALMGWRRSPQGRLRWDGEHWRWSGFQDSPACRLVVVMDFQSVVVVKVTTEARAPIYLWLEQTPGDTSWRPLRRAIVSSEATTDDKNKKARSGDAGELA
jgi:hypothetical protein